MPSPGEKVPQCAHWGGCGIREKIYRIVQCLDLLKSKTRFKPKHIANYSISARIPHQSPIGSEEPIGDSFSPGEAFAPAALHFKLQFIFPVKYEFLHKEMACGENHQSRKSGKLVTYCRSGFMSIKNAYPQPVNLWKTLVDKPVENVENYALSTVISPLCLPPASCGKLCIPVCIKLVTKGFQPCYVTVYRKHLPFENF